MNDQEFVLSVVREMPETASLREIVDELLLLDEVKRRLAKSETNTGGTPAEDVIKMLDSWIIK